MHEDGFNFNELTQTLPVYRNFKKGLQKEKYKIIPANPRCRRELILSGKWTQTNRNENFLLVNDGDDDKIVVFGTLEFLKMACDADTIFMDGTFYISPNIFSQLYTLHGLYKGQVVCFLYALLPDKSKETYVRLLRLISQVARNNGLVFNPLNYIIDYENAVFKAIERVFPMAEMHGCLFHFTQCLWRKVQECGLQVEYNKRNSQVKKMVKRCSALAFLPLDRVDNAWKLIFDDAPDHPGVRCFLDYMVETWIDDIFAIFPPKIWGHHGNYGQRTTNNLEGLHRVWNNVIGKAHPSVYELITLMKKHQSKEETQIIQLNFGKKPKASKKKYRDLTAFIEEETNKYLETFALADEDNKDIVELNFIDKVGYALSL